MSRVRCSPCEVVVPVCDCCTEEICYCSKNSIELSCAPCICNPRGPYVGAEPPTLVEGWVPDDGYPYLTSTYTNPGPSYGSIGTCGWDMDKNLFSYKAITLNTGSISDEVLFDELNKKLLTAQPGGHSLILTENTLFTPYNAQLFFLFRNQSNRIFSSLSPTFKNFIENVGTKSATTYNVGYKLLSHLGKAHLIGKKYQYYTDDDVVEMNNASIELFRNKFVPSITDNSTVDLENIKEYIRDNRKSISPKIKDGHLNQSFDDNTIRKLWKVIPSDTDQRVRVYRTPQVVRWVYNQGPVVTATNTSPSSIMSVKVNDDDTISVHRPDGTKARAHFINAETLRVYNNSGGHVYLDETPRFQRGCECVSGCYPKICSDRDRAYVFEPEDKNMLMYLLASIDSGIKSWVPAEPYISLTISSQFTDEVEFTGKEEWPDFYLLTPSLSGVDTLSSIIPTDGSSTSSSYLRESNLNYRIRAIKYDAASSRTIDWYTRFISGPGNIFYVDHNDPMVGYLNQAYTNSQDVSASMVDLNIDNILGEEEVYPRRIPYHIVIIPTDSKAKWNPFVSKSRITKMADPIDHPAYGSPWVNGYIERTLRMVPSPRKDVLKDNNYLELKSVEEAPFPPSLNELLKYHKGVEGVENNPLRMAWKATERNGLGPYGEATSSIQGTIRTFESGKETNRETDSIRRVFDILKSFKTYYDLRNNVTYEAGLSPTDIQNHPIYPIVGAGNPPKSLPKFDLWRHLNFYEFNDFLLSFNDEFFSTEPAIGSLRGLAWGAFRDIRLYDMPSFFSEKTYIHTYDPGRSSPWEVSGTYKGNQYNFRNASGVAEFEVPRTADALGSPSGFVMKDRQVKRYF